MLISPKVNDFCLFFERNNHNTFVNILGLHKTCYQDVEFLGALSAFRGAVYGTFILGSILGFFRWGFRSQEVGF